MITSKRYTFHHILFRQEELTFAEDGEVREIFDQIAVLSSPERSIAGLLEAVYMNGIARKIFGIILKPYEPTFLHALWNRFWCWYHGCPRDGGSIIGALKNSEVMEVLSDFFVLNTSWMSAFSGIVNRLVSASDGKNTKAVNG